MANSGPHRRTRFWNFLLIYLGVHLVFWVPGLLMTQAGSNETRLLFEGIIEGLSLWYLFLLPALVATFVIARGLWPSQSETSSTTRIWLPLAVVFCCAIPSWYYGWYSTLVV